VNPKHLTPDEIDQILDDELGFGTAPRMAHVAECEACRGKLEDARAVTGLIEKLPRLAPSHRFSERVMAEVPVFVPWYVAARDEITDWIPAAGRSRPVAFAAGAAVIVALSAITVTLVTQAHVLIFAANVGADRLREVAVDGVGAVLTSVFGEQTFNAVAQHGAVGFAIAGAAMLISIGAAFASLRALATSASRRRG
jgi:hypothetical protein